MMPTKFEVAILRIVAWRPLPKFISNEHKKAQEAIEHIRNHDDNVDKNDDVADIIDVPTATFSTLQYLRPIWEVVTKQHS